MNTLCAPISASRDHETVNVVPKFYRKLQKRDGLGSEVGVSLLRSASCDNRLLVT